VVNAYGWSDIALDHQFRQTSQGNRYTISDTARLIILKRLLELNFARYAAGRASALTIHGTGIPHPTLDLSVDDPVPDGAIQDGANE
jgi:hypothetical protein